MKRGSGIDLVRHEPVDLDLEGGRTRGRVLRTRSQTIRVEDGPSKPVPYELALVWIVGEERPRWVDIERVHRRTT